MLGDASVRRRRGPHALRRDVQVEPIIVVIAAELAIKAQPTDVHVVARKRIGKWLERRPATLSPAVIEAIYDMARRDTTWRTG
jgi:hypothetical protein